MNKETVSWVFRCPQCGHLISTLEPEIDGDAEKYSELQEKDESVIDFLDPIRTKNFNLTIDAIEELENIQGKTLLDIGCAEGLFLKICEKRSLQTYGVEPNDVLYNSALKNEVNVRKGYFPEALSEDEKFDIISFNDVLEHIPDVQKTVSDSVKHLNKGGFLIVSLPCSKGIIYFVANIMAKFGLRGPFERLWQKSFFTPHLHYFSHKTLNMLCENHGLKEVVRMDQMFLTMEKLWDRLKIDPNSTFFGRVASYLSVLVAYPFLKFLPADAIVHVYKKRA